MGLHQRKASQQAQSITAQWWLPILLASIAVILAMTADAGREWLSFDRPAVSSGEIWRLLTGHFVHLGISHLLLNIAGLLLIWYLVGSVFDGRQWLLVLMAVVIGVNLGLWVLEPHLLWYVGLSGLLHGLLAAGIVGSLRAPRIELLALCVALAGKLAYEQLLGPLPGSEESSGGTVIVAAHLYGAIGGVIGAGLIMIRVRGQAAI